MRKKFRLVFFNYEKLIYKKNYSFGFKARIKKTNYTKAFYTPGYKLVSSAYLIRGIREFRNAEFKNSCNKYF